MGFIKARMEDGLTIAAAATQLMEEYKVVVETATKNLETAKEIVDCIKCGILNIHID